MSIIDIAWGQAECQDLALIIDDQMKFEAIEVADTTMAAFGDTLKDFVRMNSAVMAFAPLSKRVG